MTLWIIAAIAFAATAAAFSAFGYFLYRWILRDTYNDNDL